MRMQGLFDGKRYVGALRGAFGYVERFDTGARRSVVQPGNVAVDRRFGTFGVCFYASVGEIADPAADTKRTGD